MQRIFTVFQLRTFVSLASPTFMLFSIFLAFGAPLLASAMSSRHFAEHRVRQSRIKKNMEIRGLQRLNNETLAGRVNFPSGGINGVNLGSWFVFGGF
jgi:hypothetical protein